MERVAGARMSVEGYINARTGRCGSSNAPSSRPIFFRHRSPLCWCHETSDRRVSCSRSSAQWTTLNSCSRPVSTSASIETRVCFRTCSDERRVPCCCGIIIVQRCVTRVRRGPSYGQRRCGRTHGTIDRLRACFGSGARARRKELE